MLCYTPLSQYVQYSIEYCCRLCAPDQCMCMQRPRHCANIQSCQGRPADDHGRTGLANPWRPTQQDGLLGHILGLASSPPLDLCRLLMPQMDLLPALTTLVCLLALASPKQKPLSCYPLLCKQHRGCRWGAKLELLLDIKLQTLQNSSSGYNPGRQGCHGRFGVGLGGGGGVWVLGLLIAKVECFCLGQ